MGDAVVQSMTMSRTERWWYGCLVVSVLFWMTTVSSEDEALTLSTSDRELSNGACDWTTWDSALESKVVRRVNFDCEEGRLAWSTPYGALHVEFRAPFSVNRSSARRFQTCFRLKSSHVTVKVSTEEDAGNTLLHLVTINQTNPRTLEAICLVGSVGQSVTLYLEADIISYSVGRLELEYHTESSVSRRRRFLSNTRGDTEGCRPCSEAELLLAVCTSDIMVIGEMVQVLHHAAADETEIQIRSTKVFRQRHQIFKPLPGNDDDVSLRHTVTAPIKRMRQFKIHSNSDGIQFHPEFSKVTSSIIPKQERLMMNKHSNQFRSHWSLRKDESILPVDLSVPALPLVYNSTISTNSTSVTYYGSLIAPLRCEVRIGGGQFLFVAKTQLKRAILWCAPRLEEFVKLWTEAVGQGTNYCTLD